MEESHAQATASFAAVTARGRAVTANRAICAIRASGFAPRQRVTYCDFLTLECITLCKECP